MNDTITTAAYGRVHWVERDAETGEVRREWEHPNLITISGGLALIMNWLVTGNATNPPNYIALGSGTDTVGRYWVTLPHETFRTGLVSIDQGVGAVAAIYHWYLGIGDNNGQMIGMTGLVGGAATAQANTGSLFAVANEFSPFWKSPASTYQGDWTITISGAIS